MTSIWIGLAAMVAVLLGGLTPAACAAAPWGDDGATPQARPMPDDLREMRLSLPVTLPNVRVFIALPIRRYAHPQIIPADAYLDYDVKIDPGSVSAAAGFDLESVPRTWLTLRDTGTVDQQGAPSHPAVVLPDAVGKWRHRRFSLSRAAGKPFSLALLSAEFTPHAPGTYGASYRNIRIVDEAGAVYWSFYPEPGDLPAAVRLTEHEPGSFTASGALGVSLTPDRYLIAAGKPSRLTVALHNYDPAAPQSIELSSLNLVSSSSSLSLVNGLKATLAPGETKKIPVELSANLPEGDYWAIARFSNAGKVVDARSLAITIAGPERAKTATAYEYGADMDCAPSLDELAELRQNGGNYVSLFASWNRLERSPGRYDFTDLDDAVAAAERTNIRVEFFFITDERDFPEWLQTERMLDQNGQPGKRFAMSYYSEAGRSAYRNLIAAVTRHFRNSKTVVGYQFVAGGWLDGFYTKPDPSDRNALGVYDYSPSAQAAFRRYVRDVLGLSLAQAGERYGLSLKSWADLSEPPCQPGIDTRPIWWDFQNYRCWTVEQMWDDVCKCLRAGDPSKRIELTYGGDQTATGQIANDYDAGTRIARKYGAWIHNTCYEGYNAAPLVGTYTREWGVAHSCETAGTPATVERHQQGMYELLKQGSSGYCWVGGRALGYYGS